MAGESSWDEAPPQGAAPTSSWDDEPKQPALPVEAALPPPPPGIARLAAGPDMVEPENPGEFQLTDVESRRYNRAQFKIDDLMNNIDKARNGVAIGGNPQEARATLRAEQATGVGASSDDLNANKKLVNDYKQSVLHSKLQQMPKLTAFMAKSPQYAAAISDEIDKWSTFEYLFGRYEATPGAIAEPTYPHDPGASAGSYRLPGWMQEAGRFGTAAVNSFKSIGMKDGSPEKRGEHWLADYWLGKYDTDPMEIDARNKALQAGQPDPGLPNAYSQPPGWLLAYGRSGLALTDSVRDHMLNLYSTYGSEAFARSLKDMYGIDLSLTSKEQIAADRDITDQPVPGDKDPWLSKANSLVGMVPIIAATTVHPAAAFSLMYAETSGRVYGDLRLTGWEHEAAKDVSNLIGFTGASIGAALGPMFKFNFLSKLTQGAAASSPNAALLSVVKSPAVWRDLWDFNKNFAANTLMNMAQAGSEAAMKEAFESAREGRRYDHSKATDAAASGANSWLEMAILSVKPTFDAHDMRKAVDPLRQETRIKSERDLLIETIHDNYDERGLALRSMHDAADIATAIETLKDSNFMKENPDDARNLIQQMVAPRASQTVFVSPEALGKLTPDALSMFKGLDLGIGMGGGKIPINLTDFLMHPDAETLAKDTAGAEDLMTPREAGKVDLSGEAANDALRKLGPDTEALGPADKLAPALPPEGTVPQAPENAEALKTWAEDAVSRRPAGDLEGMAEKQALEARKAAQAAFDAQGQATAHAEAGRDATEAKALAVDALRQGKVAQALADAANKAKEQIKVIGDKIAKLAEPKPDKNGLTPRQKAWRGGPEYGQAFDALMEALGAAKVRGYAAPDLTDIYVKLAQEHKLSQGALDPKSRTPFEGWDLESLNRLLSDKKPLPDMTQEELANLDKALTQIVQAGDAETSLKVGKETNDINFVRAKIETNLQKIPDVAKSRRYTGDSPEALKQIEGIQAKVKGKFSGLAATLNQPHTLMFKLGDIGDHIWFERFIPGVARNERMWQDMSARLKQIIDTAPGHLRESGQDVVPALTNDKAGNPELRVRSDVWHLMLHMGTEGAAERLARGLRIKEERDPQTREVTKTQVQVLHEYIHNHLGRNPEEARQIMKSIIEPHWKAFDSVWPDYVKHFEERGLAPPEKLQAKPFTLHGETFSGGYGGRLKYVSFENQKPLRTPSPLEALMDSGGYGPTTDTRHTIERDQDANAKPALGWSNVTESMRAEIHDIAMRPFVEDAWKIFSDRDVRDAIANKFGKDALNEIYNPDSQNSWLHVVARGSVGDVHSAGAFTRAMMNLQGRAAYSAFALNFRVMAGQVSHLPAAMAGLGLSPQSILRGIQASQSPDRRNWAHAMSETLRLRWDDYQGRAERFTQEMTGVEPGTSEIHKITDHENWSAWREMDGFLSHAIWEAAYADAMKPGTLGETMSHEGAVREADKAVTKMMPGTDTWDQSSFVRDRSVAGFAFMVRNFPNVLGNVAALNWWEARRTGKTINKVKAVAMSAGMMMAAEVLGKGLIMQGGAPEKEPDTGEWWAVHAAMSTLYPYMLSDVGMATYHAAKGDVHGVRNDMSRLMPSAYSVIASGMTDVAKLWQDGDEEASYKALAHILTLATKNPLPSKAYDLSNAARNSDGKADALKKAMGYRE